jgi:PAS domain S-box-containing protein
LPQQTRKKARNSRNSSRPQFRRRAPNSPAGRLVEEQPPSPNPNLDKTLHALHQQVVQFERWLLEARRQLDETVERYQDLFEFAPVPFASLDDYGTILEINSSGCSLLSRHRHHLVRRPLVACVQPDDQRAFMDLMLRCRRGAEVNRCELRIQRPNGELIPVEILTQRSRLDGAVSHRVVMVDLSERVRYEEDRLAAERERERLTREQEVARSSSEAKDRFLAILSHELRTPLTPVMFALARLAALPGLPEGATRFLDVIRRNLDIERQLISDLLDVNRIARGKLALEMELIDVHAIVDEAATVLQPQFEERHITLSMNLRAADYIVAGDAKRLRQVFWNLLINSLKFTNPGGAIAITSHAATPEGGIIVTVQDSGIGIEPNHISQLFAAFEQSDRGDAALGGLGLGLAICRGIVEAHHGSIRATSEGLGRGSTFEIELPTARARNTEDSTVAREAAYGMAQRYR